MGYQTDMSKNGKWDINQTRMGQGNGVSARHEWNWEMVYQPDTAGTGRWSINHGYDWQMEFQLDTSGNERWGINQTRF